MVHPRMPGQDQAAGLRPGGPRAATSHPAILQKHEQLRMQQEQQLQQQQQQQMGGPLVQQGQQPQQQQQQWKQVEDGSGLNCCLKGKNKIFYFHG